MKCVCCIGLSVWLSMVSATARSPAKAQLEVRVVDEQSGPVEDADVVVSFTKARSSNPWDGLSTVEVRRQTDDRGLVSVSSDTLQKIHITAHKAGYYTTRIPVGLEGRQRGKWLPWPLRVYVPLRTIEQPQPMYAKTLFLAELPAANENIGFDFLVGDWTSPYGRGRQTDVALMLKRVYNSRDDYRATLTITFPGARNGLAGIEPSQEHPLSASTLPHRAPETGYKQTVILERSAGPGQGHTFAGTPYTNFFMSTPQPMTVAWSSTHSGSCSKTSVTLNACEILEEVHQGRTTGFSSAHHS